MDLQKLLAEAQEIQKALVTIEDADRLDEILGELHTGVMNGQSSGDAVLDFVIARYQSIDPSAGSHYRDVAQKMEEHNGKPFLLIDNTEKCYTVHTHICVPAMHELYGGIYSSSVYVEQKAPANPRNDDYVLVQNAWLGVCAPGSFSLHCAHQTVGFNTTATRKSRGSHKWKKGKKTTEYAAADFELKYNHDLPLRNPKNRRFDGDIVNGLEVVAGNQAIQWYLMAESAGVSKQMLIEEIDAPKKNKADKARLGRVYRQTTKQWKSLLKTVGLSLDSNPYIPELGALAQYKKKRFILF